MRDAKNGTYNGEKTFCPVNAYGDCPYCDQCNLCHVDDPMTDCDDWGAFWEDWEDWMNADTVTDDRTTFTPDEINWAAERYGYDYTDYDDDSLEMGFSPYTSNYDYDC